VLNELSEYFRHHKREESAMWTKPAFTDLRIGFEVTMYFANR
jgi:pyrroloquinoline quinone biosynthesis protein A